MQKRLPTGDLLKETTNDLTRRAIDLAHDLMEKDSSLNEDQAVDKVIQVFKEEGFFKSQRQERRAAAHTQSAEGVPDPTQEHKKPVKNVLDRNIDVSKFLEWMYVFYFF